MTARSHSDWLDLASVETVFPLRPEEADELAGHLRDCVDCTRSIVLSRRAAVAIARFDPGPMRSQVRQRIREAAMTKGARPTSRVLKAAGALATLAIGVVAISLAAVLIQGPSATGPLGAGSNPFNWSTETVQISAAAVGVEANGQLFLGDPTGTTAGSEQGASTVELRWRDQNRDVGIFLGFGSDETSWWLADVRVLGGAVGQSPKWSALPRGRYLESPLGHAWIGNLDLASTAGSGPVAVHLDGATIRVMPPRTYAAPPNGGKGLVEGSRPFASGGELHCSGILQMTPRDAQASLLAMGYRVSWRMMVAAEGGAVPNPPPGLGAPVDVWELRVTPPIGVIVDLGVPVTSDGAVVMSVLPPTDPDAHRAPAPDDCPGVASPAGPSTAPSP